MTESVAPRILIVDDARDIREPLGQHLRKHGLRTRLAANAAEARRIQSEAVIHLVVPGIMMPGEDGLSLYSSPFAENRVPAIFLTARAQEIDRIIGPELGAEDYRLVETVAESARQPCPIPPKDCATIQPLRCA